MKLSILILSTPDRSHFIERLFNQFDKQLVYLEDTNRIMVDGGNIHTSYWGFGGDEYDIEVIVFEDDKRRSIGEKRNTLLKRAEGDYLAFIDSDDRIGDKYFEHAFTGINQGVDACGLTGIITEDGKDPKKFVHSMKYDSWFQDNGTYYRMNNHLNVVKSEIAKKMKFPETNHGEDHDYSKQLILSGLIKTEYWDENEVIYYYDYVSKK